MGGEETQVDGASRQNRRFALTPRFRISPAADRDLDGQAEYLAAGAGLETALRFYDAALATFVKIARMPDIGEKRESPNSRLAELRVRRVEGFEKHLIFYRAAGDGVDIVRVLHGARDIDGILAEESGFPEDIVG